jgi:hypothetical protein
MICAVLQNAYAFATYFNAFQTSKKSKPDCTPFPQKWESALLSESCLIIEQMPSQVGHDA